MYARITTTFDCVEAELWANIIEPRSLQYVAAPLLAFRPRHGGEIAREWVVGKTYEFQLYFLGFVPLGRHDIKLIVLDRAANRIVSHEQGALTSVWNHTIQFNSNGPRSICYSDEIEIQAGWLTPVVWIFAQIFYRHRQRRWKQLLKN